MSASSPPDLIVNTPRFDALIECKTRKGISIPFNRVSNNQLNYLSMYDGISDNHHGFVAVAFYNGMRGKKMKKNCILVPINYWVNAEARGPRKSVREEQLLHELKEFRCTWMGRGQWKIPDLAKLQKKANALNVGRIDARPKVAGVSHVMPSTSKKSQAERKKRSEEKLKQQED